MDPIKSRPNTPFERFSTPGTSHVKSPLPQRPAASSPIESWDDDASEYYSATPLPQQPPSPVSGATPPSPGASARSITPSLISRTPSPASSQPTGIAADLAHKPSANLTHVVENVNKIARQTRFARYTPAIAMGVGFLLSLAPTIALGGVGGLFAGAAVGLGVNLLGALLARLQQKRLMLQPDVVAFHQAVQNLTDEDYEHLTTKFGAAGHLVPEKLEKAQQIAEFLSAGNAYAVFKASNKAYFSPITKWAKERVSKLVEAAEARNAQLQALQEAARALQSKADERDSLYADGPKAYRSAAAHDGALDQMAYNTQMHGYYGADFKEPFDVVEGTATPVQIQKFAKGSESIVDIPASIVRPKTSNF